MPLLMRRVMDLNKPWSLNVSYTVDVLYDIGKKRYTFYSFFYFIWFWKMKIE